MKLVSKLFLLMLLCMPSFCLASSDKNITKLPTCSEVTVTKSVINIANNRLYKELLPSNLDGYSEKILNEAKDTEVYKAYEKIDDQGVGFFYGTIPVEEFIKFVEVSNTARTVHNKIIKLIKQINANVTAIRTESNQPNIQKVSCDAQLLLSNGKSMPIKYTAQTTSEGKIWVELQWL